MNNKKLKVNTDSMLGFRLINNTKEKTVDHQLGSKVGEKPRVEVNSSQILGSKIGDKNPVGASSILGSKVGLKPGT